MTDEFAAVVERVRERVVPDDEERRRLEAAAETLRERATEAAAELPVEADVLPVGSTARDTWLAGDRDVDVFVRFPPDLPREDLRTYGLRVGHAAVGNGREEYAEHPYVTGTVDGFDVDVVPCYRVESAADIRSAVDRTPFHTEYVERALDPEQTDDVRLLKQFLTAIGVYGSDLRTRGFSGYLVELLVVAYGGFRGVVEAAADWQPPVRLDPADHGTTEFDDPLVVVDPTDPERNVAAVLSATNLARFQHHARELLADPRAELFEPSEPDPLDAEAMRAHLRRRGTTPVAVRFPAPDVVDDQLYPQLRSSLSGVVGALEGRGFDVLRAETFAADDRTEGDQADGDHADGEDTNGDAVLFVELSVAERPAVERHEGPPVHVREHAEGFYGKYADGDAYGPFVDGDRYVVEREREFRTARAFLESDALLEVGLGADVADALADGYDLPVGDEVADLAGDFGTELARYFDPRP